MRAPFLWFLDGKIAGADEVLAKAKKAGRLDYDLPIEGLKALDRHTLQITLKEPDYVLQGYLTQTSMAAVARELVEAYGDASGWVMANPVGTGPYRLKEWRRGQKVVLEANPGFRKTLFPESADPADREIMAAMKGKRLPLIGRVEISIVEETQARMLAFEKQLDNVEMLLRFYDIARQHALGRSA
jgi:ABC-type transport system substrate-binding protein